MGRISIEKKLIKYFGSCNTCEHIEFDENHKLISKYKKVYQIVLGRMSVRLCQECLNELHSVIERYTK